ncbi:ATP synthase F1 subunit epsilon [Pelagibacteraceae bacterium]|nr:ATP synthase F1 subunit epsilon [Pelagibacteraceae bacterium]|tara:strand:+ start:201 stop:590 length:390 start_codon:yes stop_codon:yes gene_type:complete
MSNKFTVEIITPDSLIFKLEADEVTIPSYEGEMGILKDHIPLITFLRPGIIIIKQDSLDKILFVEEGTVEFVNNNLLILSSTIKKLEDLDKNSIASIVKNSEDKMNNTNIGDKEKYFLSHKIDTLKQIS